jgi:hypothetical protein
LEAQKYILYWVGLPFFNVSILVLNPENSVQQDSFEHYITIKNALNAFEKIVVGT